jgi:YD repeat-containing protein
VSYTNAKNPTPSVSFTWDSAYPRIDSMTDGTGTTSYAYVPAGKEGALQLSSETGPAGTVAEYSYGYDQLGRIDKLTVAGTSQDAVTYDAINRDIADVTPLGTFDTSYLDETGQVTQVVAMGQTLTGGNGTTNYTYLSSTGDWRLSGISFNAAAASNETLTSDDADRVDCRTNGSGGSGEVETYSYDLADRLTLGTVTSACSGGTTTSTESYGMNNADFILSKSGEATASNNWTATNTGPVNDIGTLTPSGGSPRNYTYDANGNVTSDGVRSYSWDAENRLISITEGSQVSTFTYDGLGRRVAITESGGTTGYLWCGSTLCSSYASGATLDRFLPWGEVDSGTEYYYERDHLGTVVSTTNTSGTTEATLGTDGYGWTLASSGTPQPNFGYAGMFSHSTSGDRAPWRGVGLVTSSCSPARLAGFIRLPRRAA